MGIMLVKAETLSCILFFPRTSNTFDILFIFINLIHQHTCTPTFFICQHKTDQGCAQAENFSLPPTAPLRKGSY
jgi:hypothetical protein